MKYIVPIGILLAAVVMLALRSDLGGMLGAGILFASATLHGMRRWRQLRTTTKAVYVASTLLPLL